MSVDAEFLAFLSTFFCLMTKDRHILDFYCLTNINMKKAFVL